MPEFLMRRTAGFLLVVGLAFGPAMVSSAKAEDTAVIAIELNNAVPADNACRLSFVAVNGLAVRIDALALEIVVFDAAETVRQVITLSAGAMPSGKTVVRQFDLPNMDCGDISRILLNGFAACDGNGLDPVSCLDRVKPTSRTDIAFLS